VPGAIEDLVTTIGYPPSTILSGTVDVVASLLGTFNAILFFVDPTVLSIFAYIRLSRRKKAHQRESILAAPMPLTDYEMTLGRIETNPSSTGNTGKLPIIIAIEVTTETNSDVVDIIVDDLKGL
jgi:hypothetical protein